MKIVKIFQMKIIIFTAVKNSCILHGRVFVMFFLGAGIRFEPRFLFHPRHDPVFWIFLSR